MELPVIYNLFTNKIDSESNNVAVVIFTCKPWREPVVYDVTGVENVDDAVASNVRALTFRCNYKYEFVSKVGNVFFYR